jgi:uncharacterized protein (TIGR03067 family)
VYAAFLVLLSTFPPAADPAPGDTEKIQGTWKIVAEVENGRDASADRNAKVRLVFSADRVVLKEADETREATYRLDAAKRPGLIEIVPADGPFKGRKLAGIYTLEGGSLRICLPTDPDHEAPADFTSRAGSGRILLTLEREKGSP